MNEVLAWLDQRTIKARDLLKDEQPCTTYGQRARQRLAEQADRGTAQPNGRPIDDLRAQRYLSELLGSLSAPVQGSAPRVHYLHLLCSLTFLHHCAPRKWSELTQQITEVKSPHVLLRHARRLVDTELRERGVLPPRVSFNALPLRSVRDLAPVMDLCSRLGASSFRVLLDHIEEAANTSAHMASTPVEVVDLMTKLVLSDLAGSRDVYDPYTRSGEFLTAATEVAKRDGMAPITVYAEAADSDNLALAAMNLAVQGGAKPVFKLSAVPWEDGLAEHKFDRVLTNPPFNLHRTPEQEREDRDWQFGPPPKDNDNFAWVQHVVTSLKEGGRAAMIMPDNAGASQRQQYRQIRENLVESGAVEGVIGLPPNLFRNTPISASIWLLRSPKRERREISFIDLRARGAVRRGKRKLSLSDVTDAVSAMLSRQRSTDFSTCVDINTVQRRDYSLNPADYLTKAEEVEHSYEPVAKAYGATTEMRRRADVTDSHVDALSLESAAAFQNLTPNNWHRSTLSELCEIQPGPSYSRLGTKDRSTEGTVPVVLPKHLQDGRIVTDDNEKATAELAETLSHFRLKPGDIVCTRTGTTGASAIVHRAQEGWLLTANLLRIHKLDTALLTPEYLLHYLSTPHVVAWIKNRAKFTSIIDSINRAALGELPIPLPPLDAQRQIVDTLEALDSQCQAHDEIVKATRETRAKLTAYLLSS
ncbi:type I restriction-modification system subunit M/S [Kutzneria albida]|uniref:N-6 DNA methylase n=1 Tax=Kutzneria albida TaxID=43357 RepID=UPI00046D1E72|nr:type I restriction-modification system subunit M/S [Kutzneria albida]